MDNISEAEVRKIVKKVMDQTGAAQAPAESTSPADRSSSPVKTVAIGADHGGFQLKGVLISYLEELGHKVIDCGTNSSESVDYPDFAFAVAEKILLGQACCGVIIDGAGIGSCMAANKVPGVRAAMCYDYSTAHNSREHNNANVLTLGAGLLGVNQAKLVLKTWLETPFAGGRHAKRVDKIMEIEKKYLKEG